MRCLLQIERFVKGKLDMCRWVGLVVLVVQLLSLALAYGILCLVWPLGDYVTALHLRLAATARACFSAFISAYPLLCCYPQAESATECPGATWCVHVGRQHFPDQVAFQCKVYTPNLDDM